MTDPPTPVGVLLLRVWVEGNTERELRGRIVSSRDVEGQDQETAAVGSREIACRYVCDWLEAFAAETGIGPKATS
jgi:hypothetical protein